MGRLAIEPELSTAVSRLLDELRGLKSVTVQANGPDDKFIASLTDLPNGPCMHFCVVDDAKDGIGGLGDNINAIPGMRKIFSRSVAEDCDTVIARFVWSLAKAVLTFQNRIVQS